jgi:hypothetical protein
MLSFPGGLMRGMKDLWLIWMIPVLAGIGYAAYSGGTGSTTHPYQIADVNDLLYLAAHTEDYEDAFVLTADIDLSGYTFNAALIAADTGGSVGELFQGVTFKGVFDGNDFTIRNFRIDDIYAADYLGLFGYAQNAVIKNLTLENVSIVPTAYDFQSVYRACLVGLQQGGTLEDCGVVGSLTGGRYFLGGIAGYSSGIISRCYADIAISTNQWGSSNIGGLVGNAEGGTVEDSFTIGSIYQGTSSNMGGLVGLVGPSGTTTIRNCYSHCSVIGDDENIGGCIGRLQSETAVVENCYATGVVQGQPPGSLGWYYGGFLGTYISGTVNNCFWDRQTSGLFYESAAGTPLYTFQMKTRSSFTDAGWDFVDETTNGTDDIWSICETTNYPRLMWQISAIDWVCPDGGTLTDFAFLAERWMMNGCDSNNACDGVDLDLSNTVDLPDLLLWLGIWLTAQ